MARATRNSEVNEGSLSKVRDEVIRDGLRTLLARDAALEKWLRSEVAKSYDELAADPSIGIPAEEIMERLRVSY
jgi:Arc/MetJ-type ribon-helix-helix transcriptional regulator